MRQTKRLLCALSALVMAAGLTACGRSAGPGPAPETVPPASAQSAEAAQSAQSGGAAQSAPAESGAADALESCDLTDLDGDGNSDLSASFRFGADSAQLLWFYADGGFAYNEEFSWLPGETPPSG